MTSGNRQSAETPDEARYTEAELALVQRMHVPAVGIRYDGTWGVFCIACSDKAQDYTYPCAEGRWQETPPRHLQAVVL